MDWSGLGVGDEAGIRLGLTRTSGKNDLVDEDDSGAFDDELIEIERASAVLHQRDPSQAAHIVNELKARKAEEARRAEVARQIRMAAEKKKRIRRLRIGIVAGVLLVAGAAAYPLTQAVLAEAARAEALQKSLTEAQKPAASKGFAFSDEWLDVPPAGVAFKIPRNTCSAVLGVGEGAEGLLPIRVKRQGNDPIDGRSGAIWCSCDEEEVTATFVDPPDKRLALRWLNAKMGVVGGIEVLSGVQIPGFVVAADEQAYGCADAAFATWAQSEGHGRLEPIGQRLKEALEPLEEESFSVHGVFAPEMRFAVVPTRPQRCYLAVPFGDKAPVTLRNTEGRRVVKDSADALGWCSYAQERAYSLWRKQLGPPRMLVVEIAATRVGGLTGLREAASRHGTKKMHGILEAQDLEADAVAALIASGVGESTIVRGEATGLPGKPNSRVVAFGLFETSSFLPDVAPRVPLACDPPPRPGADFQTYVCVQARPQRWRREGSVETQGAAEGRLPFWLSILEGLDNASALAASAELLAFSRRMTLLGFEPTTTDGVKDSAFGAEILGRPAKKQALAVGLTNRPPWIHPLTHQRPWTLDGELGIADVEPDASVRVRSRTGSLGADPNARRVVVWRR